MNVGKDKEVYFSEYCKTCMYQNTDEWETPCDECLSSPSNSYSHKPIYYKEKNGRKNQKD